MSYNFKSLIGAIAFAFAALFMATGSASAQSACKGLSKSACESNNACSHVKSFTRSDGANVKAFCRAKPGGGAKKASTKPKKKTAKKPAKKTSTKRAAAKKDDSKASKPKKAKAKKKADAKDETAAQKKKRLAKEKKAKAAEAKKKKAAAKKKKAKKRL